MILAFLFVSAELIEADWETITGACSTGKVLKIYMLYYNGYFSAF